MFATPVFDLLSVASISLLIVIPAVVINRRTDNAIQSQSPEEVWQRTVQEVDALVAWYHLQISSENAICVGAAYARYSSKFQQSIVDQLRKVFERAIELHIFIPREYVFFDLATSGKRRRRPGLAALTEVLSTKKARTFLAFSTSRLFRKLYRTLEFVGRVHKSWGARCIFIASNIDTDVEG